MNTKQIYYLKKFAQAERTAKKAVETTVSHRSLSEFGAALGKQDHILYGKGSVVKNANMRKSAGGGAVGDYISNIAYTTLLPVNYGLTLATAGGTAGLLAPVTKQPKDFSFTSLVPGVGAMRLTQRRRLRDKVLSKNQRDRSAQLHETAGILTNMLLTGLVGAGAGVGLAALNGGGKGDMYQLGKGGLAIGTGVGALAQLVGGIGGLFGGSEKKRAEYLTGNNMWKNYLIPGYGGYQQGSGTKDILSNT